jgi:hypothetical protein
MPLATPVADSKDYPAAHSMDTEWFAVDADGQVALLCSGEGGAIPQTALEQLSIYDFFDCLGKDEFGIPVFLAEGLPFSSGPTTVALEALLNALPIAEREAIAHAAQDSRQTPAGMVIDGQAKRQWKRMLVWLGEPLALHVLDESRLCVGRNCESPVYLIDNPTMCIRLDAEKLIYVLEADLLDALILFKKGYLLGWCEIPGDSWDNEVWMTELFGLYLFEAEPDRHSIRKTGELCAPSFPDQYRRLKSPLKARTGLPSTLLSAQISHRPDSETLPLVQTLPGVRFAESESLQPADVVPARVWGHGDGKCSPDCGDSIVRRFILTIQQADSGTLDSYLAEWQLGAEQGDLIAQYVLGYYFAYRQPPDHARAFQWFLAAAVQEDRSPVLSTDMFENGSAAQCQLAALYEHGLGVAKDLAVAAQWYARSAMLGNQDAAYCLGIGYEATEINIRNQRISSATYLCLLAKGQFPQQADVLTCLRKA